MTITLETATVYRSGSRRYFTKRAAIHAEAKAMIERKYPTERERQSYDGQSYEPGWYWRDHLNRPDVLFRRVCRLAAASIGKTGEPT